MSVPFASHWMNAIPFAVLGASLLGSGHCVAMCGGLVMMVARDRKALLRYHLGRLLGYCGLGGLAGFVGEEVMQSGRYAVIPWISTAVLGIGFIFLGVRLWAGKPLHLFRLPRSFWRKLSGLGPGSTGLLSAFLPCGWLHAFVLGAVATRSAAIGVLYLFLFWLGTLPALSFAPLVTVKLFRPIATRVPKLSAVILIVIGIGSLGMKIVPGFSSVRGHCHDRSEEKFHAD